MAAKLTLVLGGASSGKSAFAEKLVLASELDRIYLATAQIWDDEMRIKVDRHLEMRGSGWETIEAPLDLGPVLGAATPNQIILLDCATMWLSNHLLAESDLQELQASLLRDIGACRANVVVVSNEVGLSVVPDNALARRFRDAQGQLNQALAEQADLAVTVIAGLPMVLKGTLP